jgi:dimethylargininase
MRFRNAIVRPPSRNFSDGLTTSLLGSPSLADALLQHQAYCNALSSLGIELTSLNPDDRYPDSTFVEDAAIVTERCAIITRPGAPSRMGEIVDVAASLARFYPRLKSIVAPGTVDGGDVCEAGNHFFIGLSQRTNESGAEQLKNLLEDSDYTASFIDIRNVPNILHLKSGLAYLDNNEMVAIEPLAKHESLRTYEILKVDAADTYAANCVWINDVVMVAAGFPRLEESLSQHGYDVVALDMCEFEKMDGGLSCLSLRF